MNLLNKRPVCIDTSVFVSIFTLEKKSNTSKECWQLLKDNDFKIICPNIVLVEISAALSRLLQPGNKELILEYIENLESYENFSLIEIDHFFNQVSIEIALETKIRGMDSLFVATCKQYGCDLISLDKRQLDLKSIGIPTYIPEDFIKNFNHT